MYFKEVYVYLKRESKFISSHIHLFICPQHIRHHAQANKSALADILLADTINTEAPAFRSRAHAVAMLTNQWEQSDDGNGNITPIPPTIKQTKRYACMFANLIG